MVRAQVTAWSERRSQVGASVMVIMEFASPAWAVPVVLSRADHTDSHGMCHYYGT